MPIELSWESPSCLLVSYRGKVKSSDSLACALEMSNDPRFELLDAIIVDSSSLRETMASDKDIDKIAAVSVAQSKSKPHLNIAMIMGQDEASQSLAAFYQFLMQTTGWKIELFHSESEARAWLSSL